MKPDEARRRRKAMEVQKAAAGERLEAHLKSGGDGNVVVPDLIPGERDLVEVQREVRKTVRRAERTPRGAKRDKVLDDLVGLIARLVYVERVLAKDELERAALTPLQLVLLGRLAPTDLRARLDRMMGETEIEVVSR